MPLKWSVNFLKSWRTSTGYFPNSTGSSATNHRFSPFIHWSPMSQNLPDPSLSSVSVFGPWYSPIVWKATYWWSPKSSFLSCYFERTVESRPLALYYPRVEIRNVRHVWEGREYKNSMNSKKRTYSISTQDNLSQGRWVLKGCFFHLAHFSLLDMKHAISMTWQA